MPEEIGGTVRISCGGNDENFNFGGRTVGDARVQLADILHIPPAATAVVNGNVVHDMYVLKTQDHLDFRKEVGAKAIAS